MWFMILIGFGSGYSQFRITVHSQASTRGDKGGSSNIGATCDVSDFCREGDNALHTASRFGHAAAARALLKAGADADSRNGMGKTPLAMSAGREVDLVFRDHSQ